MPSMFATYAALVAAIVLETVGTAFLQKSEQFTKPGPLAASIVAYVGSFYCLSLALRRLPVGVAYAIWAGLGIVLATAVGLVVFKQKLDAPAVVGIALIVAGVVVLNGFSKAAHG